MVLLLSVGLLIGSVWEISWTYMISVNVTVLLFSLIDLFLSPNKKELTFKRNFFMEMERGLPYTVSIEIENHSRYSFSFRLIFFVR